VATGKVVRYHPEGGYGFIKPDAGGPDVFVHVGALAPGQGTRQLARDVLVSYDEEEGGAKGPRAANVYIIASQGAENFADEVRGIADRHARAAADEVIEAARARGFRV
jgi:CspA family cold shock protein